MFTSAKALNWRLTASRVLMWGVSIAIVVAVIGVIAGVILLVPVHVGRAILNDLHETDMYPSCVNTLLAILMGGLVGVPWAALVCGVAIFVWLLIRKPLLALAVLGQIAYWGGLLVLQVVSQLVSLSGLPAVCSPLTFIFAALCAVLAAIDLITTVLDWTESDEWSVFASTFDKLLQPSDGQPISIPIIDRDSSTNVKYYGEGFVILRERRDPNDDVRRIRCFHGSCGPASTVDKSNGYLCSVCSGDGTPMCRVCCVDERTGCNDRCGTTGIVPVSNTLIGDSRGGRLARVDVELR